MGGPAILGEAREVGCSNVMSLLQVVESNVKNFVESNVKSSWANQCQKLSESESI